VEGANSFFTTLARDEIQKRGVIVIRDASANKCGVIASSYEIIANLLMSDGEFIEDKEGYVADVIQILKARAEAEARLILARHAKEEGKKSFTEVSEEISMEINELYERLFAYFQRFPDLWRKPLYRDCLLGHLPGIIRGKPRYRRRVSRLPATYRNAILAAELSASMMYQGKTEPTLEESITSFLKK
jgi:glutamate dehydrogenase